ncbi:MAG: quinolinate synthase NadA [Candidatus Omnitrophica bacterium]|nr:quinolinate synthase NadA [Candidatus Omnitrophota bacterium]
MENSTVKRIQELKKARNAVILAHNYELPEVQEIADFRGDSLELARIASKTDAKIIVYCGVDFMAETASILCPRAMVLMPDRTATCPMANMLSAEQLEDLKAKHPDAAVIGYVNSSAAVKAHLDACCTSSNAIAVVNAYKSVKEIIFVPDKNLADYVSKKTGRSLIAWKGFCPTHIKILPEDIARQKKLHPHAKVLVHPECLPEVVAMADEVLSTSGMGVYAKKTTAKEMIIGTETDMVYRLKQDHPEKIFYPASIRAVCPNMKKITLNKILVSLETLRHEVRVSDDIRLRARKAIDRMLEIV